MKLGKEFSRGRLHRPHKFILGVLTIGTNLSPSLSLRFDDEKNTVRISDGIHEDWSQISAVCLTCGDINLNVHLADTQTA